MAGNFSIITPTFKGADRIHNVFKSISNQTKRPVEWIVVLDGPDPKTKDILSSFKSKKFKIRIFEKPHNHKKSAVNFGVSKAVGEWIIIADDDDTFPPNAFETLLSAWSTLPTNVQREYAGVTGLCDDGHGNIIGTKFPSDYFHSDAIDSYFNQGVRGEKWGMQRRELLLEYKFFEDAEGLVGESTVWWEIAKKYKTLYINEVVRHYLIRENSLTTESLSSDVISNNCQGLTYGYHYSGANFPNKILTHPRWYLGVSSFYVRFLLHSFRLKKTKPWMKFGFFSSTMFTFLVGLPIGTTLFLVDLAKELRK